MKKSPISKINLDGRDFYVKRDDLIDPFLAGNKYRKLYTLLKTSKNKYKKIISYGGTQSNAMLAIAAMCKTKGWEFTYYTKGLSHTQKELHTGNFAHAIALGMQHVQIQDAFYKELIASLRLNLDEESCIIDQGGADRSATEGLAVLANEIREAKLTVKAVATPSGTGTTALYLALNLPEYTVYTTPCVGDSSYLREQMRFLHEIPQNLVILEPAKKYHFAKPYAEFYALYKKILKCAVSDSEEVPLGYGIEFDLLYAPAMWKCLLEQTDEEILYIHSGGVTGNASMLARYEKKFSR